LSGVRLEPLSAAHLDDLAELVADPDVLRFTRIPEPPPPDFPRTWLARYEEGRADGTREAFAAIGDDGRFVGLALAPEIDLDAGQMELGYIVAASARGRGVGSEMLRLLTRWALDGGAQRIVLLIAEDNTASLRLAERCGYVREGVMRSVALKQGRRIDTVLWSRIPADPEPVF
jgi:RimJ/RimL family protein N-acetyltransferase